MTPSLPPSTQNQQSSGSVNKLGTPYRTAFKSWVPSGDANAAIIIYDGVIKTLRLCIIPTPFLEASGDNSWSYIYFVLGCVVDGEGVVADLNGNEYVRTSDEVPASGHYEFRKPGKCEGSFRFIFCPFLTRFRFRG